MKKFAIIIITVLILSGLSYFFLKQNNNKKVMNQDMSNMNTDMNTDMNTENKSSNGDTNIIVDRNNNGNKDEVMNSNHVLIKDFKFDSNDMTIKKGTTITWTNEDLAPHTVTENDGKSGPDSKNLNKGDSYSYTFNTTGSYNYHCSIHPNMTAVVKVVE